MKKLILFLIATLFLSLTFLASFGQATRYERAPNPTIFPAIKVATSAAIAANSSALFDVQSTTKGMKGPVMTGAQMNAISSPATGLLVYCTDSGTYCEYGGSSWLCLDKGIQGTVGSQVTFNSNVYFTDTIDLSNLPSRTSFGRGVLSIDGNGVIHKDSIFCNDLLPCDSGVTNVGSHDEHFDTAFFDILVLGDNIAVIGALPQVLKVTIPANRCDSLFTSPYELIPAPGSGKLIVLNSVIGFYDFNSTAYDNTPAILYVYFNTLTASSNYIATQGSGGGGGSILNASSDQIANFELVAPGGLTGNMLTNQALYLASSIDALGATGNGSLKLLITYTIVTP